MTTVASTRASRVLGALGALLAACAVALAAYAAHGVEGVAQSRLNLASAFAFGHGAALAALAPRAHLALARWALSMLLAGALLFCSGLVASTVLGMGSAMAPFGGTVMILGWLVLAVAALRG